MPQKLLQTHHWVTTVLTVASTLLEACCMAALCSHPSCPPACPAASAPTCITQAFAHIHLFLTRVHLITYSREGGYPSSRFPGDSFRHLQRTVTSLPMWPVCTGRPMLREVESKTSPKRLGIRWNQTVPHWLSPITVPLLVS